MNFNHEFKCWTRGYFYFHSSNDKIDSVTIWSEVTMENGINIYDKFTEIAATNQMSLLFENESEKAKQIAEHKVWLNNIRRERPSPGKRHKVGIYIRYFNQTKYKDYLDYHKKQFEDTIALCPNWELVDFYVDEGSTAPNMENAADWSRLLNDCFDGKVDLIITQKVSNVSRKSYEVSLCARLLARQKQPIGIYFISEDIFTLASYYQEDIKDTFFLPSENWQILPDEPEELLIGDHNGE